MAQLTLVDVAKSYQDDGQNPVLSGANLHIDDGEFVVFVGPSGCGKSTMLRMIAGLESITAGEMRLNGERINERSPSERGIGMVFQSYALYPHMNVGENIAFGVKYTRQWDKSTVKQAVADIADALELTQYLAHKPSELSGGQRQRVAIGRALIRKPSLFLLDEPLSNLDAALRVRMRQQIARFHQQFGSTSIYVTHDQVEAMTLADKVVVLNRGGIEQVAAPLDLYHYPATRFVAGFIGSPTMNFLSVVVAADAHHAADDTHLPLYLLGVNTWPVAAAVRWQSHKEALMNTSRVLTLGIRPEHVCLDPQSPIQATIMNTERLGAESNIEVRLLIDDNAAMPMDDAALTCLIRVAGVFDAEVGARIGVRFPAQQCHVFLNDGQAIPRIPVSQVDTHVVAPND